MGGNIKFFMFPLTLSELQQHYSLPNIKGKMADILCFGIES